MNIPAHLFPDFLYIGAHLLYVPLLLWILYSAPWYKLRDAENRHVFLGAAVLLMLLWSVKAGIRPGMNFHLLGATLLMLMFGWKFAILSLSLVLVGQGIYGNIEWSTYSLNAMLMIIGPVMFSYFIYRLSQYYLPKQFFVYTLFNGFFCAVLTMLLLVITTCILLICCGGYEWDDIYYRYLPFAPMMIFAEGFFTGMLTSSMVLFRPEWIGSFDDRRYLNGK
jgi:uncharacterized membrane protein